MKASYRLFQRYKEAVLLARGKEGSTRHTSLMRLFVSGSDFPHMVVHPTLAHRRVRVFRSRQRIGTTWFQISIRWLSHFLYIAVASLCISIDLSGAGFNPVELTAGTEKVEDLTSVLIIVSN
jgi:hypothetical protein